MDETPDTITLAAELTAAWLANPNTRADVDAVPAFLNTIHSALRDLGSAPNGAEDDRTAAPTQFVPAVSVRKSLASPDRIISMIDGKSYRTLRRHLSNHGLTPEQYRERYKLKADYPMVAPGYSDARREMAKKIGLGRKPAASVDTTPPAAVETDKPSRRKLGLATKS